MEEKTTIDEKLTLFGMGIARISVVVSLALLLLFTIYLFVPSHVPFTSSAEKPVLRYDSTRTYTMADTTFADTTKKIFKNSIGAVSKN